MPLPFRPHGLHPAGYRVPDSMARCDDPGMMLLRRSGLTCSFASFQGELPSPCSYPSGGRFVLCWRCLNVQFEVRDHRAGLTTLLMRCRPRLRRYLEITSLWLQCPGEGR